MENTLEFLGNITTEKQVRHIEGEFTEVVVTNPATGQRITILGQIRKILKEMGTAAAKGFKVDYPDGRVEQILSDDSDKLYEKGPGGKVVEKALPAGATVTAISSGDGGLL